MATAADGPIGLLAGMGTFPEVVARAVSTPGEHSSVR